MKVDVVGNLASMALHHGGVWESIHDAIAELIAADEEYDAAKAAEAEAERDGDDELCINAVRRLQWATDRRATALLACKGQDHER